MKRNILAVTLVCLLLVACGGSRKEYEAKEGANSESGVAPPNGIVSQSSEIDGNDNAKNKSKEPNSSNGFISSSAAVVNKNDTIRKFIRTVDVKYRVKSVIKSTIFIEDIASKEEGFVTLSNLTQEKSRYSVISINQDSSLETIYYIAKNDMVIRVPNVKLDTFLKQIATQIEFLDYRIIKANDASLQLLANKITQQRIKKHEERLTKAIDEKGKKLHETSNAEENVLNRQEQADNAMINNLSLTDQINYSTVSIQLYQKETIKRDLIQNEKNTKAYEPSLFQKIKEAVKNGWYICEALLVFLFNAWAFIVVGLIAFLIYRRYRKP